MSFNFQILKMLTEASTQWLVFHVGPSLGAGENAPNSVVTVCNLYAFSG